MSVETILKLEKISKSFFGVYALKDVSVDINKGEVLSIIGENGAGKSTLMNIIGGVYRPDAGKMILRGMPFAPDHPSQSGIAGIGFIHQELNLFNNLSILENLLFGSSSAEKKKWVYNMREQRRLTSNALKTVGLDLSPDMQVEKLSPGERQLVEIAKELSREPELLIFDEPTTSLTNRETRILFELIDKLRKQGKAIVYISHILEDVLRISDRVLILRDGQITNQGPIAEFSIDRMIVSMIGRDITQMYPDNPPQPDNDIVLQLDGVSKPGIAKDISFTVHKNEILGIYGLMGSGRTELARIIFGLDPHDEGTIRYKGKLLFGQDPISSINNGCAYVTENRREEGLIMEFPLFDNIGLAALRFFSGKSGFIKSDISGPIYQRIEEMRIKAGDVRRHAVKRLSGGNQQKVVIAKWLMKKQTMLIIDEPTRGIDVGAKAEIYRILNGLAADGAAILVISSELEELIGICSRILVMSRGEVVGQFDRENFDREQIVRAAFRQSITEVNHEKA